MVRWEWACRLGQALGASGQHTGGPWEAGAEGSRLSDRRRPGMPDGSWATHMTPVLRGTPCVCGSCCGPVPPPRRGWCPVSRGCQAAPEQRVGSPRRSTVKSPGGQLRWSSPDPSTLGSRRWETLRHLLSVVGECGRNGQLSTGSVSWKQRGEPSPLHAEAPVAGGLASRGTGRRDRPCGDWHVLAAQTHGVKASLSSRVCI